MLQRRQCIASATHFTPCVLVVVVLVVSLAVPATAVFLLRIAARQIIVHFTPCALVAVIRVVSLAVPATAAFLLWFAPQSDHSDFMD